MVSAASYGRETNINELASASQSSSAFSSSNALSAADHHPQAGDASPPSRNGGRRVYTHNPYRAAAPALSSSSATATSSCNNNSISSSAAAATAACSAPTTPSLMAADTPSVDAELTAMIARAWRDPTVHASTLHRELLGRVAFIAYPTEPVAFSATAAADEARSASHGSSANSLNTSHNTSTTSDPATLINNDVVAAAPATAANVHNNDPLVRLFVGQLPYRVTEMQLQWIFHTFGRGASVHDPERITKKSKLVGCPRVPTGCIHLNVRRSHIAVVVERMNKRLLVDDSGVWFARDDAEKAALDEYVARLKADPRRRFPDRPYDSVVVQEAVSSFQAAQPRWVSNAPEFEPYAVVAAPAGTAAINISMNDVQYNNNHHNNHQQHYPQQPHHQQSYYPPQSLQPLQPTHHHLAAGSAIAHRNGSDAEYYYGAPARPQQQYYYY